MIICIVIKGSIGLWVKGRGGYADNRLAEPNNSSSSVVDWFCLRARILIQVTIYRRLLIGRDGHLDQSEAYDIS